MLRYDSSASRYDNRDWRYNNRNGRYDNAVSFCDRGLGDDTRPRCGAGRRWIALVLCRSDFIAPSGAAGESGATQSSPHQRKPILLDMGIQWDAHGNVRPTPPAKTNAERQAAFRARNPDYYRLLQARRRARIDAGAEAKGFAALYMARMFPKMPLMLPAPEQATATCLDGMAEINAIREALRAPRQEAVPIPGPRSHAA
jgi:hypothetical protein